MINLNDQQRVVNDILNTACAWGITGQYTEDETLSGRTIRVKGREKVNFAHCSYLGLEMDQRLRRGAIDAVERFGSQFSSSRSYLSLTIYREYEARLAELFGYPTIVSPTTTLGHFSTLPLIIGAKDTVVLDRFVHSSVKLAAQQLRVAGVHLTAIPHNDLNQLETRIRKHVEAGAGKVWYLIDGVYSMQGHGAPLRELRMLQEKYEQLYLYIDDAHGMSWAGKHGCGYALEQLGALNPQTMLVTSLNKAFASGGGAIICHNEEMKTTIQNCGLTMMFCGPLQPASLGAGLASTKLHLSPDIVALQDQLRHKIRYFNRKCRELNLALVGNSETPIRYIGIGTPEIGYEVVSTLIDRGFFVNIAAYPSVATNKTGLRITLSNHITTSDIDALLSAAAEVIDEVFDRRNYSQEQVTQAFLS